MSPLATLERPIAYPDKAPDNGSTTMPYQKFVIGQNVYTHWIESEDEENPGAEHREDCVVVGWLYVHASAEEVVEHYSNLEPGYNYVCRASEPDKTWRDIFHESILHCD